MLYSLSFCIQIRGFGLSDKVGRLLGESTLHIRGWSLGRNQPSKQFRVITKSVISRHCGYPTWPKTKIQIYLEERNSWFFPNAYTYLSCQFMILYSMQVNLATVLRLIVHIWREQVTVKTKTIPKLSHMARKPLRSKLYLASTLILVSDITHSEWTSFPSNASTIPVSLKVRGYTYLHKKIMYCYWAEKDFFQIAQLRKSVQFWQLLWMPVQH